VAEEGNAPHRVKREGKLRMTLKSKSRVTQGHWKRNHWTDHTRFSYY